MEILLTVSYVLDTDKYDFWDRETGYPKQEISQALENQFPVELLLTDKLQGKRNRLSHIPLGVKSEKCPLCGKWMTSSPEYYSALALSREINGTTYCENCAYDVRLDSDK